MQAPPYKQVMSFADYEKFLSELAGDNMHKLLLLDFTSLGGLVGLDSRAEAKLKEQDLLKSVFTLKIPFNAQCQFAQRYKVNKA